MKADTVIGSHREALEQEFFRTHDEASVARLQEHDGHVELRAGLAAASGIKDEALLERLIGLGLRPRSLAPLALVPLVEVAWADGRIDSKERHAVLRAAHAAGVDRHSPGHALLDSWLERQPAPGLRVLWKQYIAALCGGLDAAGRASLRDNVLGRAREIAEATGGFLGLGSKISVQEEQVLQDLAAAFDV